MQEISVIKENSQKKISLAYDEKINKLYIIRRIYDDKRDIYRTLKEIDHPNIPHVINVEFDGDTIVYEEYIDGQTLSSLIAAKATLTKKQIRSIAKQLAHAMSRLHKSKIIHRDIKPDNIIMNSSGNIWLIDYDIARIYRDEVRKDTDQKGTFGYAPIEQYGLMPTDHKTDIYSFGVTLMQLLDYAGIKGALYKTAERCRRLDPAERYSTTALLRSLALNKLKPAILACSIAVFALAASVFSYSFMHNTGKNNSALSYTDEYVEIDGKMVKLDDELMSLLCFSDFKLSEHYSEYSGYGNFNSTFIFNCEDLIMTISFMEDMQNSGNILMGKGNKTPISCDAQLKDGVFSVVLKDSFGNSFSHEFEYSPKHSYKPLYTKNRRINAEMVCWDMDGDLKNELLIGICDCSFNVENKQIYVYFNYSQGWCIKYDESRGFVLCDGDMFSENSKFALIKGDLRVHLPVWSIREDNRAGYELKGDTLVPFY